jgi:hypothetical protein
MKLHAQRYIVGFMVGFVALIGLLAALAPRPFHQSVSPSSIKPGAITGSWCPYSTGTPDNHIVSAVKVDNAGYDLYQVTCADGTTFQVAQ